MNSDDPLLAGSSLLQDEARRTPFAAALRLIGEGSGGGGEPGGRLVCEATPDDDYAEEIHLRIVLPGGQEFHVCALPVASDACAFGDDEDQDNEWDAQYRSLGALFAAAPDLLRERDQLRDEVLGLRATVAKLRGEEPAKPRTFILTIVDRHGQVYKEEFTNQRLAEAAFDAACMPHLYHRDVTLFDNDGYLVPRLAGKEVSA